MDKRKVPIPRSDPRFMPDVGRIPYSKDEYAKQGYPSEGTPTDKRDHPTYNIGSDPHEAPEAFRGAISGFGPKTLYSIETGQMNTAVGVQDKVRRQYEDQ